MSEQKKAQDPYDLGVPADFIVDTRLGIEAVLQAVVRARRPVRIASRTTRERITARLLEIDTRGARIVFVPLSAGPMKTWLNDAREIVFSTDHDGVPIEFTCQRPSPIPGDSETYSVGLPSHIIRLQRRSAYRLPAPAILCTLRDESMHGADVKPKVLDVSAGGVDITMPLGDPPLNRDATYSCTIVLPGYGTVWVPVRIVSAFKTADTRRYGCQFVDLPAASELLLQRYILEEQRARRRTWQAPPKPST
jgi:c-di-GMP-binding flagellar brake protein YcgR